MNSNQLKFAAGVLLFGAWLALVIMGKAPADHLVDAIALTIAGLGIHGATISTPSVPMAGLVEGVALAPAAAPTPAPTPVAANAQVAAAAQPTIQ
ncbi:hypothetical protein [Paraburkholderia phenoliruptrix]|uniref:hypothetical protein n=1 Tax=Paraburkholderia phenoliruptrix TaxID=252970 RepID=UPI001C6E0871|nr:hypothetical protein [Paraburkholderia phenoliruptrix]MBW9102968.1 hypothetical protein [Paraburkholderia phenoliruptrix]MBW9132942.1 hypothetical protein [Paraburkholderia ginsengiterrae]